MYQENSENKGPPWAVDIGRSGLSDEERYHDVETRSSEKVSLPRESGK